MQPYDVSRCPQISEDDLLAFQFSHFGDDTKPDCWFVDANTAVNFESGSLGFYEDGTLRTLTDEQIAMFRHSETKQLLRERRLQRGHDEQQPEKDEGRQQLSPRGSPRSDVSSIEGDLLGLTRVPSAHSLPGQTSANVKGHGKRRYNRASSRGGRSESSRSSGSLPRLRRREIPYDQRHKRKWEDFIDENDPLHGSMTHRRLARQLDEQADAGPEEIDYGEDESAARKQAHQQIPPGRRVVSYEDD